MASTPVAHPFPDIFRTGIPAGLSPPGFPRLVQVLVQGTQDAVETALPFLPRNPSLFFVFLLMRAISLLNGIGKYWFHI